MQNPRRYYLDYNSTSPCSQKVIDFLRQGDFCFANPTSQHSSGKAARKIINQTKDKIQTIFTGIKKKIAFHSGMTEALTTFVLGNALIEKVSFVYFETDHSVAHNLAEKLEKMGHEVIQITVDNNGNFDSEDVIKKIHSAKFKTLLNYTWVNNESGVVWPLDVVANIKKETNVLVHVDAAQAVGKLLNWQDLDESLDVYSFSGHKFGALKGIGFSVVNNSEAWQSLIVGGGQQGGLRGGTENVLGIQSLTLALEDILHLDLEKLVEQKKILESYIKANLGDLVDIVGEKAKHGRCLNTIQFVLIEIPSDISLVHFDLEGLEVSPGSACTAGSLEKSHVLYAMGYGEHARNGIRISLSFDFKFETDIKEKFDRVLTKIKAQ